MCEHDVGYDDGSGEPTHSTPGELSTLQTHCVSTHTTIVAAVCEFVRVTVPLQYLTCSRPLDHIWPRHSSYGWTYQTHPV